MASDAPEEVSATFRGYFTATVALLPTSSRRIAAILAGHDQIQLRHAQVSIEGSADPVLACGVGVSTDMIGPPTNTRVWIAAGVTDLRAVSPG